MRTALLTAATAAVVLGLAPPASAAAPTTTSYGTAFTTLGAADGETFFYVDGYDLGAQGGGIVDVFGPVECTLPETGTPAAFTVDGTTAARLVGTLDVECWDADAQRGARGTITVDLAWTATGPATRTRLGSSDGCTTHRLTAPAVVEGSVHLRAPALGLDVSAVPGDRPAEVAQTVTRCR